MSRVAGWLVSFLGFVFAAPKAIQTSTYDVGEGEGGGGGVSAKVTKIILNYCNIYMYCLIWSYYIVLLLQV